MYTYTVEFAEHGVFDYRSQHGSNYALFSMKKKESI